MRLAGLVSAGFSPLRVAAIHLSGGDEPGSIRGKNDMDRLSNQNQEKPSIYAETAYDLILSGVKKFQSEEDQRLLLDSLLCQCAVFARMLGGDQAFQELLERLRDFDFDAELEEDSGRTH